MNTKNFNRRQVSAVLGAGLLLPIAVAAQSGAAGDSIVLGQSTTLSGPLGDLGQEVLKGSKVFFDALNAKGGVNGRKVVLDSKDDAYDAKKTIENVEGFISADVLGDVRIFV